MPNDKENTADQSKVDEKIIISSDAAKLTSELASNALQNNNIIFANALLNELEAMKDSASDSVTGAF